MIKKERVAAFFDAMLAIIMTILVLELDPPESASFAAFWDMKEKFFSYALSFFWLGTMWVHLVQNWSKAEYCDNKCLWWTLILLFFSSLIPFATNFVDMHFHETVAGLFYVTLTLLVTVANLGLNYEMRQANKDVEAYVQDNLARRRKLRWDLLIKSTGLVVAFIWPSFALVPILIALIYIIV